MKHSHGKDCPETNKPIPNDFIWTDHDREGLFNSCNSCNKGFSSVAHALHTLKKEV